MVLFFTLLSAVLAQGPGHGISKDTRACSEGVITSTYNFMLKYFPVTEAMDDCDNHGVCACGRQARFSLNLEAEDEAAPSPVAGPGPPGGQVGFGLHCVYAAGKNDVRVGQSGNKTQEEIEAVFQSRFNNMAAYDSFMEYNTGLYTSDISSFATSLKNGNVPFLTLYWNDTTGDYVSVLVNPPMTAIVYEVVGDRASLSAEHLKLAVSSGPRFHFDEAPRATGNTMTALWVSRASTDVARDKKFFETVMQGVDGMTTSQMDSAAPDGTTNKMLLVQVNSDATTKVRLIQPQDPSNGQYSVSWWEGYLSDVHAKYMTSVHCGWDLLADNHNAYDWIGSSIDQSTMMRGMDELGYTYFCKSVSTPMGSGTHCYINTPYGYQFQLDGHYSNPPSNLGTYSTDLCATYLEYC